MLQPICEQDLPEQDQPSRNVIFVDAGHTSTQVNISNDGRTGVRILL